MPRFTPALAASLASLVLVSFSLPALAEGRGESTELHYNAPSIGPESSNEDSQQSYDSTSVSGGADCSKDAVDCGDWRYELSKEGNRTKRIVLAANLAKSDSSIRDAIAKDASAGNIEAREALQVLAILDLKERARDGDAAAQRLLDSLDGWGSEATQQVLAENDAPWFGNLKF